MYLYITDCITYSWYLLYKCVMFFPTETDWNKEWMSALIGKHSWQLISLVHLHV